MTSTMTAGAKPAHRERLVRSHRENPSKTVSETAVTIAPEKKAFPNEPLREPVSDLSRPTSSPVLKRNVTELRTREKVKRDREREEALARERAVQQRD